MLDKDFFALNININCKQMVVLINYINNFYFFDICFISKLGENILKVHNFLCLFLFYVILKKKIYFIPFTIFSIFQFKSAINFMYSKNSFV